MFILFLPSFMCTRMISPPSSHFLLLCVGESGGRLAGRIIMKNFPFAELSEYFLFILPFGVSVERVHEEKRGPSFLYRRNDPSTLCFFHPPPDYLLCALCPVQIDRYIYSCVPLLN